MVGAAPVGLCGSGGSVVRAAPAASAAPVVRWSGRLRQPLRLRRLGGQGGSGSLCGSGGSVVGAAPVVRGLLSPGGSGGSGGSGSLCGSGGSVVGAAPAASAAPAARWSGRLRQPLRLRWFGRLRWSHFPHMS
ncbi:hypothetical protein GCM10010451_34890 [Streptomyces virens]|uniref:Uncharacterized protein n=1 Tax=Streptomyces virens TaxID=285572 RepID=A0ABP6PM47_9ACTN